MTLDRKSLSVLWGVQVRQHGFAALIKKDVTKPSIPWAIDYLFLSICLSDKMLSPLHSGP